jgi:hypothetical protein
LRKKSDVETCIWFRNGYTPPSSAMNKLKPMPIGARNVPLCFSAASMKIVKTSCAVRNISMKRPRVTDVPGTSVVRTSMGPGNRAETRPADAMPPMIWAMKTTKPRNQPTAPMRHMPKVTWECVSYVVTIGAHQKA